MRKYLFNGAILGAIGGGWSLVQTTKTGRRDWKLLLMWVSWALSLAIAVGTTGQQSDELHQQDVKNRESKPDHEHRGRRASASPRRRPGKRTRK